MLASDARLRRLCAQQQMLLDLTEAVNDAFRSRAFFPEYRPAPSDPARSPIGLEDGLELG